MGHLFGYTWYMIYDKKSYDKKSKKSKKRIRKSKQRGGCMKKLKFWIWKSFHRNIVRCKHFCGTCAYYEACKYDMEEAKQKL